VLVGQSDGSDQLDPTQSDAETGDSQQPSDSDSGATQQGNLKDRQPTWTGAETRQAQQLAEIKKELGLPKNASTDSVREALDALRQPQQTGFDPEELDPVAQARLNDYEERLWQRNTELYGEEVVPTVRELWERTIKERDPDKFMRDFIETVYAVTEGPEGSDEDQQPEGEPQMPELGNADVPLDRRTQPTAGAGGRANTGDVVGYVRDLGARLGISSGSNPRT
jgi:hypothetical protein